MRLRCLMVMAILIVTQGCKTKQEAKPSTHPIVYTDSIEGFLGIKWGEPIASAKKTLLQRNPEAHVSTENPYNLMFFDAFEIVDTKISMLSLKFTSHGFCTASAYFMNLTDDQSATLYRKLMETMEAKYGQPSFNDTKSTLWLSRDSCSITIFYDDNSLSLFYLNNVLRRTLDAEEADYKKRIEQQIKEKHLQDL